MQHGQFRSYRGSRLVSEFFLRFSSFNFNDTFKAGEHCSTSSSSSSSSTTATSSDSRLEKERGRSEIDSPPVLVSSFNVDDRTVKPLVCRESNHRQGHQTNQKYTKTNKKKTMIERRNPLFTDSGRASSEIPEWLQEFRENLVDDEVPEHRDSHVNTKP